MAMRQSGTRALFWLHADNFIFFWGSGRIHGATALFVVSAFIGKRKHLNFIPVSENTIAPERTANKISYPNSLPSGDACSCCPVNYSGQSFYTGTNASGKPFKWATVESHWTLTTAILRRTFSISLGILNSYLINVFLFGNKNGIFSIKRHKGILKPCLGHSPKKLWTVKVCFKCPLSQICFGRSAYGALLVNKTSY